MTNLRDIFSVAELEQEIAEGWVRKNKHPDLPLWILNYTEKAQFSKHWNPVTLWCRGLIIDETNYVVARPWKKFFNWGEVWSEVLPTHEFEVEVTDKKDGSLGILYNFGTEHFIATRGSFTSDQAIHATKVWNAKYKGTQVPSDFTFLFEIIYPENRIVLDYKSMDDLVLLGAVHKKYGYYFGPTEAADLLMWDGPVNETLPLSTISDCLELQRNNSEGVVVRHQNIMVKIKQEDYVALHKLVTGLNERTVWERLKEGDSIVDICNSLPDEFHEWVQEVGTDLRTKLHFRMGSFKWEYQELIKRLPNSFSRKDFAMEAIKSPNKAYLFSLLDNKPIEYMVWDSLKPEVKG